MIGDLFNLLKVVDNLFLIKIEGNKKIKGFNFEEKTAHQSNS